MRLDGKQDIEKYGIEPFIAECKQSVWKYTNEWKLMSDRLAYWVDMDNPYVTYHDDYIESVWWALKTIALFTSYQIVLISGANSVNVSMPPICLSMRLSV